MTTEEVNELVETFNSKFPVGSSVMFRKDTHSEYIEHTVSYKAFDLNGNPVCFLLHVKGCVSISPDFIK